MTVLDQPKLEAYNLYAAENGRVIRVGETRVSLDTVIGAYLQGSPPDEIVRQYPALDRKSVEAAIAFYEQNREAVEKYLEDRERQAALVRERIEKRSPPNGIRERLLPRRHPE
ncbi:MAG TPA: DUF433 domain-containing protein [Armatimonadota bacterium]|nr:DUF433 domain-containing protein [Armatimonadota bacterium]